MLIATLPAVRKELTSASTVAPSRAFEIPAWLNFRASSLSTIATDARLRGRRVIARFPSGETCHNDTNMYAARDLASPISRDPTQINPISGISQLQLVQKARERARGRITSE